MLLVLFYLSGLYNLIRTSLNNLKKEFVFSKIPQRKNMYSSQIQSENLLNCKNRYSQHTHTHTHTHTHMNTRSPAWYKKWRGFGPEFPTSSMLRSCKCFTHVSIAYNWRSSISCLDSRTINLEISIYVLRVHVIAYLEAKYL